MQAPAFSPEGLDSHQLEKEEAIVFKSIDSVQEAIKEIDFKVVDQILLTIFKKAYPELSAQEFNKMFLFDGVYPIRVKYSEFMDLGRYGSSFENEEEGASAYYNGETIIVLAREHVDNEGNVSDDKRNRLTKILIHEIMHLMSLKVVYDKKSDTQEVWSGITKVEKENEDDLSEGLLFSRLDEALTEIAADAVYSEYLARTGGVTVSKENRSTGNSYIERNAGYLPERVALAELVDMLARHSGVDEGRVYQALFIEYIKSGDLMRSELFEEYKDSEEIRVFFTKLKQNNTDVFLSLNEKNIEEIGTFLSLKELPAVKAIVSRDYIGEVNKRKVVRGIL